MRKHAVLFVTLAAFAFLAFLATFHLTESPPVWFDEGHYLQAATNTAFHSLHVALQVAPNTYVSGGLSETTGYPLLFLVAGAFRLLGPNLLVARSVMVVCIILFVFFSWWQKRDDTPPLLALYATWLLVTFAPLYGNGKNVLGEVPGLMYLSFFFIFLKRIESKHTTWIEYLAAGLTLGLAVATKPIFFLVLLPVAVYAVMTLRNHRLQNIVVGLVAFCLTQLLWVWVQFGGQTFSQIMSLYANPFDSGVAATSFTHNALLFITTPQPLYALALLCVWVLATLMRLLRRQNISNVEYIALGFSILTYIAFLRIIPYYRYFFLGEIFALLYLPSSLWTLWPRRVPRFFFHVLIAGMLVFQTYQCFFSSWVAVHYTSHRSEILTRELGVLPPHTTIFLYDTPEVSLFLPQGMPYYQYFFDTTKVIIGKEELPVLARGTPDFVLTQSQPLTAPDLSQYKKAKEFDRYTLWQKK
jgi:hypothetical protein